MNRKQVAPLFALLFLLVGLADVSAQAFFTTRVDNTNAVRFTTNTAGAQVAIDGQPAGTLPLTVYVTAGPHRFTFTTPDGNTKTIVFPVNGDVDVPYFATTKTFPLTVNVNVPGANLAIDGAPFAGNSTSVTPGNHTLTASSQGYRVLTIPFVQPSNANIITVTLVADTYPLTVNTNVAGASLAVDGVPFAGNATSVSVGNHTLTASFPGYRALTLPFVQQANANVITVTLVADTYPLTVRTNVAGAALAVDGVPFAGNATSVSVGNHTLTASFPGYRALTLPFVQQANANVITVTLVADTYPLTVNTNVPGATLSVDGVPFAGNSTAVTLGNHTLTASAPGYQPFNLPFVQQANPNVITLTLVPLNGTLNLNTGKLFKAGTAFQWFVNGAEVRGPSQTLPPGTYTVRIVSGPQVLETTVSVGSGQTLTLTPSLQWDLR